MKWGCVLRPFRFTFHWVVSALKELCTCIIFFMCAELPQEPDEMVNFEMVSCKISAIVQPERQKQNHISAHVCLYFQEKNSE